MFRKGSSREAQFNYWNLRRRGISQSEIARRFEITRQSVSKSVKVQERDVVIRLLEWAQTSGILPVYYDQILGILIGTIPPLGNIKCLLIIDDGSNSRIYYDPEANPDKVSGDRSLEELRTILERIFDSENFSGSSFDEILDELMILGRGD
jgi:transcriptional regulator with XRE-family HTH domain